MESYLEMVEMQTFLYGGYKQFKDTLPEDLEFTLQQSLGMKESASKEKLSMVDGAPKFEGEKHYFQVYSAESFDCMDDSFFASGDNRALIDLSKRSVEVNLLMRIDCGKSLDKSYTQFIASGRKAFEEFKEFKEKGEYNALFHALLHNFRGDKIRTEKGSMHILELKQPTSVTVSLEAAFGSYETYSIGVLGPSRLYSGEVHMPSW